ncbi:hypothetical protein K505DRAFT_292221 [Melanomma pulvis-pyrius CBS 109.77]|uniref:P-loop containing nucleoside triphosphate hydrolase protein n=1 Tax=Melanomma pulvis-pyrius CBS 109.77 TaxID=1314802 RepID=A0A6A6XYR1_9PLEO|nr:hypothetical protein K505DRAFT_292221 [Melanomma pulvis-pyrius CBS 109.77]
MESIKDTLEIDEPLEDGLTVTAGFKGETFRLRTYQAEMVEKSLDANIIVAMDTGSGKTHIALARTAAELESCHPNQLVWFLAPTVILCEQQFTVFQTALPAYGIKLLCGKDGVEHWTDQTVWDSVLENTRIVLSTHAVLLDALTHAFVKMDKLALIIFDEAHHCTQNHPANQIMANFYKPLLSKGNGIARPRILGLSASPVMRANANRNGLEQIEKNMNAVAKTPKIHRSELIRFVSKPEFFNIPYPIMGTVAHPLLEALVAAYNNYEESTSRNAYCAEQLKKFSTKAKAIFEELGPSATEWYIHQCIGRYKEMIRSSDRQLFGRSNGEREHLLRIIGSLPLSRGDCPSMSLDQLSPKVQTLIDVLVVEAGAELTGLVFVEQRVWVAALSEILSIHPKTRDLFRIGTFVGTSQSSKRKMLMADLVEVQNQRETLDDFRTGKKNIILTTSVLEEGIDVSSCHLVVCFDRPRTLKSFIQRRGRARKHESRYFILQPKSDPTVASPQRWESLEEEMKLAYLDDLRDATQAEEREMTEEDRKMFYRVPSTGALLTLDNALPHLNHFCSLLGSGIYVDSRPQFSFTTDKSGLIAAEVMLPISVDATMRKAHSSIRWITERMAKKDAAFQAYKGLHIAGLVNDNLLPDRQDEKDIMQEFQIPNHTPSLVEVSPPFDPWIIVAKYQQQNPHTYHRALLKIQTTGEGPFYMVLLMPFPIPEMPPFILHWNEKTQYSVECSWLTGAAYAEEVLITLRAITRKLLHSVHRRMEEERYDFLSLFVPSDPQTPLWDHNKLHNFDTNTNGYQPATVLIEQEHRSVSDWGFVSLRGDIRKYMLKGISRSDVESPMGKTEYQLQTIRAPKRRDFLHRISESNHKNSAYTRSELLNATDCHVDNLPAPYSIFALFVPSILWKYEVFMVADTLRTTLIEPVLFEVSHLPLLVQALTSSEASPEANYQRLEFFGDCILKFIASVHLMAANPTWPESFLTGKKSKIVSNGFLARATMKAGLDKFVITKRFTGSKWAPRYVGDVLLQPASEEKTERSSKLLADIIESLIGASYVKGGFSDAFLCVKTLLTLEKWTPIPEANTILFNAAPCDFTPTNLLTLETLVGYTFSKKMLLLEAITHASYAGPNVHCSYERLEFLGDAVLDFIISKRLFEHTPELSHQTMHTIRTAMANAGFLTFRMFETTLEERTKNTSSLKTETVYRALWQFLRHSSPQLLGPRDLAIKQHNEARGQILEALHQDRRFPWHLLSLTDAPKFLSDIVESVIGAIYVDSHGSIAACEVFVKRLGIIDALQRILRDGVDCLHPKERLGHLAVEKKVDYVKVTEEKEEEKGGNQSGNASAKKHYRCQVRVGGVDIGGPVEGLKKLNSETIAAWKACGIIEGSVDVEMSSEEEWHDADEGGGVALDGGIC